MAAGCTAPSHVEDAKCKYASSVRTDWNEATFGVTPDQVLALLQGHVDVPVDLGGGPVEQDRFTWSFEPSGQPRRVELVSRRRLPFEWNCIEGPALDIGLEMAFSSASGLSVGPHRLMVRVYADGSVELYEDWQAAETAIPPEWSDVVERALAEHHPSYEPVGLYPFFPWDGHASVDDVPSVFERGNITLKAESAVGILTTNPTGWRRAD